MVSEALGITALDGSLSEPVMVLVVVWAERKPRLKPTKKVRRRILDLPRRSHERDRPSISEGFASFGTRPGWWISGARWLRRLMDPVLRLMFRAETGRRREWRAPLRRAPVHFGLVPPVIPFGMSNAAKLIAKMRRNPRDWRIEVLKVIAHSLGIDHDQHGTSHVIFPACFRRAPFGSGASTRQTGLRSLICRVCRHRR